jgi:hypothetical protein
MNAVTVILLSALGVEIMDAIWWLLPARRRS